MPQEDTAPDRCQRPVTSAGGCRSAGPGPGWQAVAASTEACRAGAVTRGGGGSPPSPLVRDPPGAERDARPRVRTTAGASWERIGAVLGTTALTAWNGHQRWIEEQVELFELTGRNGPDDVGAVEALHLAGERPVGLGHVARTVHRED